MAEKRIHAGRVRESLHNRILAERQANGGQSFEQWLIQHMARERQYREMAMRYYFKLTRLQRPS